MPDEKEKESYLEELLKKIKGLEDANATLRHDNEVLIKNITSPAKSEVEKEKTKQEKVLSWDERVALKLKEQEKRK